MGRHFLKLNSEKTEVILFVNKPQFWNPACWITELGILPIRVQKVKNLGIVIDEKWNLHKHICSVISDSFNTLKIIKKIHSFIPLTSRKTVISLLILSKLDYCNGLYVKLQKQYTRKLQSVQNAAARLILDLPKFHPVSASIKKLHWLTVANWIKFKALCLTYKALHDSSSRYLKQYLSWYIPNRDLRSKNTLMISRPRFKRLKWGWGEEGQGPSIEYH